MAETTKTGLSPIEDVIADAKAGKLFILVDDQNRENEGDLCTSVCRCRGGKFHGQQGAG